MAQSPKSHRYKGNYVSKNNALYKVSITKQGPMQIKLLLHPSRIYASVNGFDSNGLPGEAEQSGLIKIGDALVAINDIVLVHKRFEEVLEIIKSESLRNLVRHLYFCRKQYCQYIIEDRIDISAFLRTGVVSISTSSSIHNPHALSYAHQANIVAEDLLSNIELITNAQQADMVAEDLLSSTELVCKHEVNEEALRAMVSAGVPDDFINLRAVAWKVLLSYLPLDRTAWKCVLDSQRRLYGELLLELVVVPTHDFASDDSEVKNELGASAGGPLVDASGVPVSVPVAVAGGQGLDPPLGRGLRFIPVKMKSCRATADHPLCCLETSTWHKYFRDLELMDSIQKDVVRTYPELHFFSEENGACQQVLRNILFMYAKLNPGVQYVQGMNELVGTMYYVFANDSVEQEWREHAEADTFFCFSILMSEFRDMFISKMDNTHTGITGRIGQYIELLQRHDRMVENRLRAQGVDPSFYSLRWITTLLSREFDLLDTIRLWDSLFADEHRNEFLNYLCCAMVLEQRDAIMVNDFAENMGLLQSYPPTDVTLLLTKAQALRDYDKQQGGGARGDTFSFVSLLQTPLSATTRMALSERMDMLSLSSASFTKLVSNVSDGVKSMLNAFGGNAIPHYWENRPPPEARYLVEDSAIMYIRRGGASDGSKHDANKEKEAKEMVVIEKSIENNTIGEKETSSQLSPNTSISESEDIQIYF